MMYILIFHFTIQTLQLSMVHYTVTKQFYLAICTVKCGLVSEWVTRANHYFFKEILKFGTAMISQVFHFFIH